MSCSTPLVRIKDDYLEAIEKITGYSGSSIISKDIYFNLLKVHHLPKNWFQIVPCGNCLDCRLEYSKTWSIRMLLESKQYEDDECWFLTLTYDDDHLPEPLTVTPVDGSKKLFISPLVKKDLQNFWKRLRKNTGQTFKYFACGEYGDKNHRPHYHACVFGLKLDDLVSSPVFQRHQIGEITNDLYESGIIDKAWSENGSLIGLAAVAPFSYRTAGYVARYVVKKLKGVGKQEFEKKNLVFDENGVLTDFPFEFVTMSTRPAIGLEYFQNEKDYIYRFDEFPLLINDKVETCKPSRYFDKKFEEERPDFIADLKRKRQIRADEKMLRMLEKLQLDYFEYLQRKVDKTKQSIRSLERFL